MTIDVWQIAEQTGQPVEVVVFHAVHHRVWQPDDTIAEGWETTFEQIVRSQAPTQLHSRSALRHRWSTTTNIEIKRVIAGELLKALDANTSCGLEDLSDTAAAPSATVQQILDEFALAGRATSDEDGWRAVAAQAVHLRALLEPRPQT